MEKDLVFELDSPVSGNRLNLEDCSFEQLCKIVNSDLYLETAKNAATFFLLQKMAESEEAWL